VLIHIIENVLMHIKEMKIWDIEQEDTVSGEATDMGEGTGEATDMAQDTLIRVTLPDV